MQRSEDGPQAETPAIHQIDLQLAAAPVDVAPNDPDWPVKGLPSIRFDMRLSRESAADKTSCRVGADPSAIMKPPAGARIGQFPAPAPAAG